MVGIATKLWIALGLAAPAAAVGVLLADVPLATEAPPHAGSPFEGIPDLEIRYYDVSGRTAEEIRAAMDRLRPTEPDTGMRYDGYTRWNIRWYVPGSPAGPCRLDRATVTLRLTVTLPRLVDPAVLPPATLARWRRFTAWLEAHEATHARIALAGRTKVLEAIRRAECGTAEQAADAAMDAIERRSAAFDRLSAQDGWIAGTRAR
jgi:predicted secreted Zn-dependent protease